MIIKSNYIFEVKEIIVSHVALRFIYFSLGWIHIPIRDLGNQLIRTFMIQIAITETHQNNRNTQVRQIKIYRPIEEHGCTIPGLGKNLKFSTVAFQQHATLR